MKKMDILFATVMHGIGYNIVEVTLIAIIRVVHFMGNEVYPWFLWLMFAAAALWTVLASTRDAQDDAQEMVMERDVYVSDFALGAFFALVLCVMTLPYGLAFGSIFFVAAIQNLRYSALAYDWITEEYDDNS